MSRKSQVISFLRQQAANRNEQAEMMRRAHSPNNQQIGEKREQARLFEDAASMCEKFEGPLTTTAAQTDAAAVRAAREAEAAEAKEAVVREKKLAEAPKQRKKWTRKAIAEASSGPAIAANDPD